PLGPQDVGGLTIGPHIDGDLGAIGQEAAERGGQFGAHRPASQNEHVNAPPVQVPASCAARASASARSTAARKVSIVSVGVGAIGSPVVREPGRCLVVVPGSGCFLGLRWATTPATPAGGRRPSLGGRVAAREVWSGGGSLPLDTAAL